MTESVNPVGRPPYLEARDAEMCALANAGMHPSEIGKLYGLSRQGVNSAVTRYRHRGQPPAETIRLGKPVSQPLTRSRIFCGQCDRNVLVAEAKHCRSRFCKASRILETSIERLASYG